MPVSGDPSMGPWPYAFPLVFVILWSSICYLLSRWGGWTTLASAYREMHPFTGERLRFRSCQMRGMASYNNCVTIGANFQGIHLSVFFLFRIGHPPLFIPWEDVTLKPRPRRWLPAVELNFRQRPHVPLIISRRLSERLQDASGRAPADHGVAWPSA